MKVTFTQPELKYGRLMLDTLVKAAEGQPESSWTAQVARVAYKFTPNASYLSLTFRDRKLIESVLVHRVDSLIERNSTSEEVTLARSILTKLHTYGSEPNEAA